LQSWGTFVTITGGGAAALTGLLFVAVSIRIDFISGSAELRNRAAQVLTVFGMVVIASALVAIPGQLVRALGAEVIALTLIMGVLLWYLDRRAGSGETSSAVARLLEVAAPNLLTLLLMMAAGVLLTVGQADGLDVLVAPILIALAGGMASAWLLLTRISAEVPGANPGTDPGPDPGDSAGAYSAQEPGASPGADTGQQPEP
jgi:hypothetical protein